MSNLGPKPQVDVDAWLADWPAPDRSADAWDDLSDRIGQRIADLQASVGDDAWLNPPLPHEPGEDDGPRASRPSGDFRMADSAADKPKRASLKDIAQRVSQAPPNSEPAKAASATESPRPSSPPVRKPLVSRPSEARDSDSGIVDLAVARASIPSLPDSGVAPASSGLFDEHELKPGAAPPQAAASPRKSSNGPLFGGGIVAIAAIAAAAFFVVRAQKAPDAAVMSASEAPPMIVAPAAQPAEQPIATATAKGMTPEGLALEGEIVKEEAEETAARAKSAADKPGSGKLEAAPSPAASAAQPPPAPAPAKKSAAPGEPGDLAGAMATAVGANKDQPTQDTTGGGSGPSGSVPQFPSQGALQGAMGAVMGSARSCLASMDDPSRATVTFASSGSVSSVSVSGPAAGTAADGCIRSALKRAKVAPFRAPTYAFSVTVRPY